MYSNINMYSKETEEEIKTKILNPQENSKQKVSNKMAKSKALTHQTNIDKTVTFLTWYRHFLM